ncbi:MAG TPA: hypothetical protein VFI29_07420 [Hanamia sp.]|nr:hypothetical protein [Hanamia sp.]
MVLLKGKPREQNLQRLVADMKNEWKECEPLREVPEENEYVDSYCKT